MAWVIGTRIAKDRQTLRYFWLIPLRDFVGLVVWLAVLSEALWCGAATGFGWSKGS